MNRGVSLVIVVAIVAIAAFAAWSFGLFGVDTDGRLRPPTVDADVSGGEVPKVQVETAKVRVDESSTTIRVPTITVGEREVEVKLPTIKVTKPGDDGSPKAE
jgi:hypothetical protein